MTDVNNKAIAGRSLAEWKKLARQDDCFDRMVPSDLRCILAAIEAPAQEPVAWGESYDGGKTFVSCTVTAGSKHHTFPLYTTPPDHLARVAAAYRDAAEQCRKEERRREHQCAQVRSGKVNVHIDQLRRWEGGKVQADMLAETVHARTPADAEAHLTALLRAEYERGKAETQTGERVQHLKRGSSYTVVGRGKVQTDTPLTDYAEVVIYRGDDGQVWVRPVSEFEDGRFALLTQEGLT